MSAQSMLPKMVNHLNNFMEFYEISGGPLTVEDERLTDGVVEEYRDKRENMDDDFSEEGQLEAIAAEMLELLGIAVPADVDPRL